MYFNRVPYDVKEFAGEYVLVEKDVTQDEATAKSEAKDIQKQYRERVQRYLRFKYGFVFTDSPGLVNENELTEDVEDGLEGIETNAKFKHFENTRTKSNKQCKNSPMVSSDTAQRSSEDVSRETATLRKDPEQQGTKHKAKHSERMEPESGQRGPKPPRVDPVKPKDIQSDFAQQHILINLRALAQNLSDQDSTRGGSGHPMFIIVELDFKKFLNHPDHQKATAKMVKMKGSGDFDFIIITKNSGILCGEAKSVGLSDNDVDDDWVKQRFSEALDQLSDRQTRMKDAIKDISPDLAVRTSVLMPYVSCDRLQRLLASDTKLLEVSCFILCKNCVIACLSVLALHICINIFTTLTSFSQ
jgi:hypothetical protein